MAQSDDLPASSTFEAFLSPGVDRASFISAWLRARDIPHTLVDLAGKRHIVVRFAGEAYDPRFRMKTLVAHYDRVSGTSGANDNSASCFQLMLFAERLAKQDARLSTQSGQAHNIRIFFTDGEEAAGTKGIAGQGAYALGEGFRKLKMTGDDVYVFDACGRGETLVLSTAGMDRKGSVGDRLSSLHERAAELAIEASRENWVRLPTPYSDNAGFLAAGIASQVITVLPREEAGRLLKALSEAPEGSTLRTELARVITENRRLGEDSPLAAIMPETWRLMHTEKDSAATLSASAFRLIEKFLMVLAARMEPAM